MADDNNALQIELSKLMLQQLAPQRNQLKFEGPGAWWGAVPNLMQDVNYAMSRNKALEAFGAGKPSNYGTSGGVYPEGKRNTSITTGALPRANTSIAPGAPQQPGAVDPSQPPSTSLGKEGRLPVTGDRYLDRLAEIENEGKFTVNKFGYRGPFQFSRAEEAKYGINDSNWRDPTVQINAAKQKKDADIAEFTAKMGRPPMGHELYLVHNQGIGGAVNHLNNPDSPAWENMYNTAEGRRKGPEWAQRAIKENVSAGIKPQGNALTSRAFVNNWRSRFGDIPVNPPNPANSAENIPPDLTGRMNAGGPGVQQPNGPQPGGPQPGLQQLAQAGPTPSQPTSPQSNPTGQLPGGNAPFAPYLESPQQYNKHLDWLYEHHPDAAKAVQEYIDDFRKRAAPQIRKSIGGEVETAPTMGQGGGPSQFQATEGFPFEAGKFKGRMVQNPDGSVRLVMPGNADKFFETANKFWKWQREQEALDTGAQERMKQMQTERGKYYEEYTKIQPVLRNLREMEGIMAETGPDLIRGPTKDFSMKAGQFLDNISSFVGKETINKYFPDRARDLASSEVFEKLNSFLASEATKAISSRGTNFELQTFMRTNPSLFQSYQGTKMLIDLLQQEYGVRGQVAAKVGQLREENIDEMPKIIEEEYEKNYPILRDNKGEIHLKTIKKKEDLQGLPSGARFITPGKTMGIVP